MKISEAFRLYEENYILVRNMSLRLVETHHRVGVKMVEILGDKDISKLTLDDIGTFYKKVSVGRSINTVRNDMTAVRQTLRYLRLLEYDCLNPELVAIPKRRDTVPAFLTSEEVTDMIEKAFNLRNKVVISLLYSSGIRLSEMIQLDRGSIIDRSFTVVGKGGKARLCFIDERTEMLIDEYIKERTDDCEALIISYKNKARMTASNVQMLIKNSAKRAGIDKKVTPHTLRHSFATNFLRNNGNMRYLSQMLGHANLNTTARYAHVVDVDLRKQYMQFHTV